MTHPSVGGSLVRSNQRLEFLGDRVLGLVIAGALMERSPKADEGVLAPRLNALVRKETCADIANTIGLGTALIMDMGEAKSGGRAKKAVLGDACEALIGALYLDGGLAEAKRFIETYWSEKLGSAEAIGLDGKTTLQEWAHKKFGLTPSYETVQRTGPDHAPEFIVRATVGSLAFCEAKGTSKREAEQAAAEAMLRREGVWT
jgi:ribonuclease-3